MALVLIVAIGCYVFFSRDGVPKSDYTKLLRAGHDYVRKGNYLKAQARFEAAVGMGPYPYDAHASLAFVHYGKRENKDAYFHMEEALRIARAAKASDQQLLHLYVMKAKFILNDDSASSVPRRKNLQSALRDLDQADTFHHGDAAWLNSIQQIRKDICRAIEATTCSPPDGTLKR